MFREEWKAIYENYYRPLYLYALSLTGNPQDAEDLLQETFVKAYLAYQETGSLKYWLITVLKHEFSNLQRKRKREILDNGDMIADHETGDGDVLSDVIREEERRRLFCEIHQLPIPMREVLIESIYFHMKDSEISELHNMSNENVRKIRSRAKQRLIERMKEVR